MTDSSSPVRLALVNTSGPASKCNTSIGSQWAVLAGAHAIVLPWWAYPAVLAELQGHPLDDRRVQICDNDVRDLLLEKYRGRYQAILLDVDNSPAAWCLKSNSQLYDERGLGRIKRCLSPGGILGIWSAHPEPAFVKRLRKAGFTVSTETVRAFGGRGSRHTIFLARSVSG